MQGQLWRIFGKADKAPRRGPEPVWKMGRASGIFWLGADAGSLPWAMLDGYAPVPSALFLAGLVYAMVMDKTIERRAKREVS